MKEFEVGDIVRLDEKFRTKFKAPDIYYTIVSADTFGIMSSKRLTEYTHILHKHDSPLWTLVSVENQYSPRWCSGNDHLTKVNIKPAVKVTKCLEI